MERLYGWGRVAPSSALVTRPGDPESVREELARALSAPAGVIARGAGRSYGDAAQNAHGSVLDMTGLGRILAVDRGRRTITAQAGASLARVLARLAEEGATLPVLPGTRHVTVGGAIASDIHGKSHHRDGSLANHVRAFTLCAPGGELIDVSRASDPELFDATLGGMGLTGAIVAATLSTVPLATPYVSADTDRTRDIDEALCLLSGQDRSRWSVAWLDLLAGGPSLGRAVVSRADPWPADSADASARSRGAPWRRRGLGLSERAVVQVPAAVPAGALRPSLVRAFNAARWHRAPRRERGRPAPIWGYLFPLDALGGWSRLYGRAGLVQYQLVVPAGQERALVRCLELLRARALPVYLAVLKRFGASAGGPLSFPIEGFTLALDLPAGAPGLMQALDELDELVAGAGGRVYLSKDVRLHRDVLPVMYPQLDRFRAVRERIDPAGVLRSDLGRRLGLCEARR